MAAARRLLRAGGSGRAHARVAALALGAALLAVLFVRESGALRPSPRAEGAVTRKLLQDASECAHFGRPALGPSRSRRASSLASPVPRARAGGTTAAQGRRAAPPVTVGSADSGPFVFVGADAGSIHAASSLTSCDPVQRGSSTARTTGFTCYAQHTSASWWVDLYGTCTFDCTTQNLTVCASYDGVCGCPVPEGQTTGSCSLDGGVSEVCVPAVKPGTSPGANDGDGGCGTPRAAAAPSIGGGRSRAPPPSRTPRASSGERTPRAVLELPSFRGPARSNP